MLRAEPCLVEQHLWTASGSWPAWHSVGGLLCQENEDATRWTTDDVGQATREKLHA